jgi:RNA polymerase sigma-70 factor (ECF subfamily)
MTSDSPLTRPSLLQRLRGQRDERAWAEFLGLYEPLVLRLMRRRGLQDSDARDTTQQVLLRISGAIERYQPDGARASFRRWLNRIARNVVVTFLTRQSRQPESLGDRQVADAMETEPTATLESDLFDHEYRQQVLAWATEQVRCEFRDTTWRAFVETSVHGRPIAEVAGELKLSPGSVYVARSRVIARLRVKVEEFEADQ